MKLFKNLFKKKSVVNELSKLIMAQDLANKKIMFCLLENQITIMHSLQEEQKQFGRGRINGEIIYRFDERLHDSCWTKDYMRRLQETTESELKSQETLRDSVSVKKEPEFIAKNFNIRY